MRTYYTYKSISEEGEYYLVRGWYKAKAFWQKKSEMQAKTLFTRKQDAVKSLKRLLEIMPEYGEDELTLIEVEMKEE